MKKLNSLLVLVIIFSVLVIPFIDTSFAATVPGIGGEDDGGEDTGGAGTPCKPLSSRETRAFGYCEDGIDNDCDGKADCYDSDCACSTCTESSTKCSDGYDNDCNGEADYDSTNGMHGDANCDVGVRSTIVTETSYCPGDTIHVQCVSTVAGVNSIEAYAGSTKCIWDYKNAWNGHQTFFTCSIPADAPDELTVKCMVDTEKSYAVAGQEQATKLLLRNANCCSKYGDKTSCVLKSSCKWISDYCLDGNYGVPTKYYAPADPDGVCVYMNTYPEYVCVKDKCNAACDSNTGCADKCVGDIFIDYAGCGENCLCAENARINCNANNNAYCKNAQCKTTLTVPYSCIYKQGTQFDNFDYYLSFSNPNYKNKEIVIKMDSFYGEEIMKFTTNSSGESDTLTFRCPGTTPNQNVAFYAFFGTTMVAKVNVLVRCPEGLGNCIGNLPLNYYCDSDEDCESGYCDPTTHTCHRQIVTDCPYTCGTPDICDTEYTQYTCSGGDTCYVDGGAEGTDINGETCCLTPTTQTACTEFTMTNEDSCCPDSFVPTSGTTRYCEIVNALDQNRQTTIICKPAGQFETAVGDSIVKGKNEEFTPCVTTDFKYNFLSSASPDIYGTCSCCYNKTTGQPIGILDTCDLQESSRQLLPADPNITQKNKIKMCCTTKLTTPSQAGTYKYICELHYRTKTSGK